MDSMLIFFIILALATIASALGLLVSRSAVYAALYLVLNFTCVAIFYLMLGAPFIALTQITVYAGAIMILFLFVIMLLGAEKLPKGDSLPWQRPLAIILAAVLMLESVYLLFQKVQLGTLLANPDAQVNSMDAIRGLGITLFSSYLLPFEVTSILLLVAMVGAIILTKQEKGARE
ncbi:NADH-quinone oxidoreductase subunit J [Chloroflexota bacterium]